MRLNKIADKVDSVFGINYMSDGEMVMFKMITTSPLAEYKARELIKSSKHPVELWHFPKYGFSLRLCIIIK